MRYAVIGLLSAILLQGCAGSSSSSAPDAATSVARPTSAGMQAGGCGDTYGRVSAFQSCRDS